VCRSGLTFLLLPASVSVVGFGEFDRFIGQCRLSVLAGGPDVGGHLLTECLDPFQAGGIVGRIARHWWRSLSLRWTPSGPNQIAGGGETIPSILRCLVSYEVFSAEVGLGLSALFPLTPRSIAHVLQRFQRLIDLHLDLADPLDRQRGFIVEFFNALDDGVDRCRLDTRSAALSFGAALSLESTRPLPPKCLA
jgi:hypothetical protein